MELDHRSRSLVLASIPPGPAGRTGGDSNWSQSAPLAPLISLVNPYGIHLHMHILDTLGSSWIKDNVTEFKSPTFRREELFDFMALLFAGLISIAPLVRKRSLVEPLWILFLGYCALVSIRHVTIFALVAAPIVAVELSEWWGNAMAHESRASLFEVRSTIWRGQLTAKLPEPASSSPW